jgi:hypothetical protein
MPSYKIHPTAIRGEAAEIISGLHDPLCPQSDGKAGEQLKFYPEEKGGGRI